MKKKFDVNLDEPLSDSRSSFLNAADNVFAPTPIARPVILPPSEQIPVAKTKTPRTIKEDPMTCAAFTIRTSTLAKLQDLAATSQADSGELNLSMYIRGIFKRHIETMEAAQQAKLDAQ